MESRRSITIHPTVERLAAYSWRLLVIGAAAIALAVLIGKLWVVFLPLVLALFLTRVLNPPTSYLKKHGWRPALAAATVLLGFLLSLGAVGGLIGVAVQKELPQISPTVTKSVDEVETWLVTDAPGNLNRTDIAKARKNAGAAAGRWVKGSSGTLVSGVMIAFQLILSVFFALIITFFALKDGSRAGRWAQHLLPVKHHRSAERLSSNAWATLGGYLRGAALLGLVEGIVIGVAMALVGAKLAVPIGVFTFFMAFIPFAGAIVAGVLAVLISLGTAGLTGALIVLVVAVVVQQLDNELLAPVIYGKALDMHPVVILLSIATGGALFGIPGTFLAVPVTAVVINVLAETRRIGRENKEQSDAPPLVDSDA